MKKFVIPIVIVMVGFLLLIGYTVTRSVEKSYYTSAVNEHLAYIENNPGIFATAENDGESVKVNLDNTWALKTALDRSAIKLSIFHPSVGKAAKVTITFPDGAVYSVYDGGKDDDKKDVAYIHYEYDGKSRWFSLTGYNTFERVSACTSLEGFGSPNDPA